MEEMNSAHSGELLSASPVATQTVEVPVAVPSDSGLSKSLLEHGSPIVVLLLLIGLLRALTRFVQVCKN